MPEVRPPPDIHLEVFSLCLRDHFPDNPTVRGGPRITGLPLSRSCAYFSFFLPYDTKSCLDSLLLVTCPPLLDQSTHGRRPIHSIMRDTFMMVKIAVNAIAAVMPIANISSGIYRTFQFILRPPLGSLVVSFHLKHVTEQRPPPPPFRRSSLPGIPGKHFTPGVVGVNSFFRV